MRPCFTFTAKADTKPAVLALDEDIGFWGTQSKDFRASLDAVEGDSLDVEINSMGGDVMAGLAMYNMLRTWANQGGRTVTTRVTGLAASIASVIALAGDKREMPKNSFAMVHSVSGGAWGTANELREAADVVDKIQGSLRNVYMDRMGVDEAKATEIMAKDTWLTAQECLDLGFATNLTDDIRATAKFDLVRAELPAHVAAVFAPKAEADPVIDSKSNEPPVKVEPTVPDTPVATQIANAADAAGLGAHRVHFAMNFACATEAQARIKDVVEIQALCNLAGKPDMLGEAVAQNKSVVDMRAALIEALAEGDEHTDTHRPDTKSSGASARAGATTTEIWARRKNAQTAQKKG